MSSSDVIDTTSHDGAPLFPCPECKAEGKSWGAKSKAGLGRHRRIAHGVIGATSKQTIGAQGRPRIAPQLDRESVRHSLDDYDPHVIVVGHATDAGPLIAESAVMPDKHYAKQVADLLRKLGHKAHVFRLADGKSK